MDLSREAEEPVIESEKNVSAEKLLGDEEAVDVNKESPVNEPEEKEPKDKVTSCSKKSLMLLS